MVLPLHLLFWVSIGGFANARDPKCDTDFSLLAPNRKPLSVTQFQNLISSKFQSEQDKERWLVLLSAAMQSSAITSQQREVIRLVMQGKKIPQVADELKISPNKVYDYFSGGMLRLAPLRSPEQIVELPTLEESPAWLDTQLAKRNMFFEELYRSGGIAEERMKTLASLRRGEKVAPDRALSALDAARAVFESIAEPVRPKPPTRLPGESLFHWINRSLADRRLTADSIALLLGARPGELKTLSELLKDGETNTRASLMAQLQLADRLEALFQAHGPGTYFGVPWPNESNDEWVAREMKTVPPSPPPQALLNQIQRADRAKIKSVFLNRTWNGTPSHATRSTLAKYFQKMHDPSGN